MTEIDNFRRQYENDNDQKKEEDLYNLDDPKNKGNNKNEDNLKNQLKHQLNAS